MQPTSPQSQSPPSAWTAHHAASQSGSGPTPGPRPQPNPNNHRSSRTLSSASMGILQGQVGASFNRFPTEASFGGSPPLNGNGNGGNGNGSPGANTPGMGSVGSRGSVGGYDKFGSQRQSVVGLDFDYDYPQVPYADDSSRESLDAGGAGAAAVGAQAATRNSRFVRNQSTLSYVSNYDDGYDTPNTPAGFGGSSGGTPRVNEALLWNEKNVEEDDWLHDPESGMNPKLATALGAQVNSGARNHQMGNVGKDGEGGKGGFFNTRGWSNTLALVTLVFGLLLLFLFAPVYVYFIKDKLHSSGPGFNVGGINGSGQVPVVEGFSGLRDVHTPQEAWTRKGFDGHDYNLVFSDEFEVEGRTFWPGDDPYWEAVDLHYWATTDLEWYDPDAVTTKGGNLVITQSQQPIHDLNFRSGMLQSWNKMCFTGGYIEVNMSLPGSASHQGFWVGAWTIGNLVRPGYGATAEGVWPYSYEECDVGTYPGQMRPDKTPTAAATSGDPAYGGPLSHLPGQKLSACTCEGEEHPGPKRSLGRGGPEIDIIEAKTGFTGAVGENWPSPVGAASQSIQIGPMDAGYEWPNSTDALIVYNASNTKINPWHGSVTQESLSIDSGFNNIAYEGKGFETFGFEYEPGNSGHITWAIAQEPTVQLTHVAIGPNKDTEIAQRPIAQEPMSIVLNFAISTKFEFPIDWGNLVWPADVLIDYVRVYQRAGSDPNLSCDPDDYPTADYINDHPIAYQNPNMTTWNQTGYDWPKNSGFSGC